MTGILNPQQELLFTLTKFGKHLCHINLLLNRFDDDLNDVDFHAVTIDFIINGCPNLKSLSLESHSLDQLDLDHSNLVIWEESLEKLSKSCKELKDLKITKAQVWLNTGSLVEEILPNCNVEIKECDIFRLCVSCGFEGSCIAMIMKKTSKMIGLMMVLTILGMFLLMMASKILFLKAQFKIFS